MHSPLPDSSALEAGILEDSRPSRLSRVQDNVRNLLRNSHFGSVASTPTTSPAHNHYHQTPGQHLPSPPSTPTHAPRTHPPHATFFSATAESPTNSSSTASTASSPTSPTAHDQEIPGVLFPPPGYRHTIQQMAHASALFNTRAVAALDHPDLSDPSLVVLAQQKAAGRRRGAWTRSRKCGSSRGSRKARGMVEVGSSQCLLCVLAALLLSSIVATYLVLATTSSDITPTFHILFILGIILALIVFAHTVVRMFLMSKGSRRQVLVLPVSQRGHRQRRREHRPPRIMPPQPGDHVAFVPASPIRVHMPADEVRPDSREAEPTATATVEVDAADSWDKDVEAVPNPPPAYGRWRGSVRANPDLLHWQALPSPVDEDAAELPSPTYEEAMTAQRTGPPSYVTRESPARRTEPREGEVEVAAAQAHSAEPEMVEGTGIGLGV